jgi:hypothetical protein
MMTTEILQDKEALKPILDILFSCLNNSIIKLKGYSPTRE